MGNRASSEVPQDIRSEHQRGEIDLEIIQYFEDSIGRTKNLIEEIFKKEPLLN